MSVHRTTRAGGVRWVVRWRENGAQRSRSFDTKKDAEAYDLQLRRLRQHGELADELERRRTTVQDAVLVWLDRRVGEVSPKTAEDYARHFDLRVLPQLGGRRLATLTPADVEAWISWMRRQGDRDATIIKACTALQSALSLAVRDRLIPSNPVADARKPSQRRRRTPLLVKPSMVERIRVQLEAKGRERDVVLLDLLAYAGLRPESEAVELPWRHVRDRSLLVVDSKRGRERTVVMVDQLHESLAAWRLRRGRPPATALVVPSRLDSAWDHDEWTTWMRGTFRPRAVRAGLPEDVRARDLRGSFVSLLVHEGRSIVEVARQLGHSPEVCLRDYAQVFDDHDPRDRRPASEVIAAARAEAHDWWYGEDASAQERPGATS